ncbi:MAG: GNAT family N-acetyltransferase [Phycisphaerales bacterium]|nr:GNAT family N-acetyltransferase [Phycisphaerales bacterium]
MARPPLRDAVPADMPQLYDLFSEALRFDLFSPGLLEEKLFANPRPLDEPVTTANAARFGRGERYRVVITEDERGAAGAIQIVTRPWEQRGWIGLFAVRTDLRRRGIGRGLLEAAIAHAAGDGARTIDLIGIPGNYFAPALDPRYTTALCLLERLGFEKTGDCCNLVAELNGLPETGEEEARLTRDGIEIRRAVRSDEALLDTFFAAQFGAEWRFECELAMRNAVPALHLALRDGQVIAFSAHSSQNREWGFFGPMGTAPEARGSGCGRVLLIRCLADLAHDGHATAVIPWVGPIGFYARSVKARVERVFWRMRRTLA